MVTRLKPTRLEHVVDGVRLRSQLSTAALERLGDEVGQRQAALDILKAALFRGADDRQGAAGERGRRDRDARGCCPASPTR